MTVSQNLTAIRIASWLDRHSFDIDSLEDCESDWWDRLAKTLDVPTPTREDITRIITVLKSQDIAAVNESDDAWTPPASDPFAGIGNVNYTGTNL